MKILNFLLILAFFISCLSVSAQVGIYDEILNQPAPIEQSQDLPSPQETPQKIEAEVKDELENLLPKLTPELYSKWTTLEKPLIWTFSSPPVEYLPFSKELLQDLRVEKILKQSYQNENRIVDVLIYKTSNFEGAYSTFTLLRRGNPSKLKVGKNVTESESAVSFWKDRYFVDIYTGSNDPVSKEFIIFASQDISKVIQQDSAWPVVAIQLPALNRISGSEKYCLGILCCKNFFQDLNINFEIFSFPDSGGLVKADYQDGKFKDEGKASLILARYISSEAAEKVFSLFKTYFENLVNQETEGKDKKIDMDFDSKEILLKIKKGKDDYTIIKQKGNLLAIVYNLKNKKLGEKFIDLVPWPVEIVKPGI